MSCALCLAMAILVSPTGTVTTDADPGLGANAALKYWQAFATLPRFTTAYQDKLEAECLTMPLNAQAEKSVTRAEYALNMMQRGAKLPQCNWAIGWADEGLGNLQPYLEGTRLLSSLACLRARMRFEEGKSALAVEDILAAMTLGRHASQDGSLPSILIGYNIERRMSEMLSLYLPKLDARMIKDLKKRMAVLPLGGSLARGVREEQILEMGWIVRKVKEAKDKQSLLSFLSQVRGSPEEGRALLDECGGSTAGVLKYTEELISWYPLLAKHMELPLDQFEKEQEREG